MLITALEVDWREGTRGGPAGLTFLCPGCGQHAVTVWLRPPMDMGMPEPREHTYPWEYLKSGLGDLTVLEPIDLAPCGVWLLVEGELAQVG